MDIQTPEWVKHAVFYQIFPDRFARSQRSRQRPPGAAQLETWDSPPTFGGYKGGDLWGLIEQLDYLVELGITAIYLTPIFQSTCNHRYHTHDYYQVDPLLGGNEAFQAFLTAAHDRNLRVVLDGVFNHTGRGFFFFNDILENGPDSPWLDWFRIEKWPLSAYDGALPANYKSWVDNRALPQFNHDNPAVKDYIMAVGEHWMRTGIDGWRLDVPFEVKTPGFWQEFRDRIKAINPEAYIVGEVWRDARPWLDGSQFDGVMNYLFTAPTIAFTAGDRVQMDLVKLPDYDPYPALDAVGYGTAIADLLALYPWEIQQTQLNLLSSHDVARLLTVAGGDKASLSLAALLQMTFPGAPSIYYGDEVGLPGALDPDSRRVFPPADQWDQALLNQHKTLIALRHTHPALRTGHYTQLVAQGDCYCFARHSPDETLVIAVNAGDQTASLTCDWAKSGAELGQIPQQRCYGSGDLSLKSASTLQITLPPRQGSIWCE